MIKKYGFYEKFNFKTNTLNFRGVMEAFLDLLQDIWDYLKVRKKYWLAPLIITILLMGALIIFTQGSVVAPFIYSIF